MSEHGSMDGKYYRTCTNDVTSSRGWFKNVLLLGLVSFVPVFGQMTVSGYAYEWAHKAAWGVSSPMPYKIYGRKNSKMLRWGWFAILIGIVFAIIPYLVYLLGSAISGAVEMPAGGYAHSGISGAGAGAALALAAGGIIEFVALIGTVLAGIFSWVGTIRMTVYDRLGTGLQFGQVWKMAKRDFGGLMRIFGMQILIGLVICLLGMVVFGISAIIGGVGFLMSVIGAGMAGDHPGMPFGLYELVMAAFAILPLLLVDAYIVSCMGVYAQLLVARAVGYWCRQFDVSKWGTKDEPLPFEREQAGQDRDAARPERPATDEQEPQGGPATGEDKSAGAAGATGADVGAQADTAADAGRGPEEGTDASAGQAPEAKTPADAERSAGKDD